MFKIGRICVKLAGRDAGKKCVVVDVLDNNYVMIDGETRRRKCNVDHLEPLQQTIDVKKSASHEEVSKAFEKLGFNVWNTTPKNASERPVPVRKGAEKQKSNVKDAQVVKPVKKAVKKAIKAEAKEEASEEKETKKVPAKKKAVKKEE